MISAEDLDLLQQNLPNMSETERQRSLKLLKEYKKDLTKTQGKANFLDFIKFKRAIAKSKKMLNFDKETVKVDKKSGNIISTGQLTIVGLPNEFN